MPENDITLLIIINKCQRNEADLDEWDLVYKYCYKKIYLYSKIIGINMGFSDLDLEDTTQNIIYEFLIHFPKRKFISLKSFKNYIFKTCKNDLIDSLRKTKKNLKMILPFDNEYELLFSEQSTIQNNLEEKELKEHMKRAIKELPKYCQNILVPLIDEGLTLAEIAKKYNISIGSIYTQYKRCIEKLREKLEK